MKISPVTKSDLPELAGLYQQLIPNQVFLPRMRNILAKNKGNPNRIALAAKIKGRLVGTLLAVICEMYFGRCKSFMVVEDVVVDQAHRRSGIGSALMKHIERYARKQNCSYIMLITDTDRVGSQRFYKALGYKTDEYRAFKKHL